GSCGLLLLVGTGVATRSGPEVGGGGGRVGFAPRHGRAGLELVDQHRHEGGVGAGGGGADERQVQLLGGGRGLRVKVVDDLHVIGDEADGGGDDAADGLGAQLLEP